MWGWLISALMKAGMAAKMAGGAVSGAAQGAGGAIGGMLGGGGGKASPEPPRAAISSQTPQMPPPQQAPGFGKQIAQGYLDNYMASQGIDMGNPPSSLGQGIKDVAKSYTGYNKDYNTGGAGGLMKGLLKGYAEKWANMTPEERKAREGQQATAGSLTTGQLSDFTGTIQTAEARNKKKLPFG